jgi:rSAM/selenodomain-associated transferase 1
MNKGKRLLLIFYRNPELGKVKTRLAVTLGEERALAIYLLMSAHTRKVALTIPVDRIVYYSEFIDTEDHWQNTDFQKRLQHGDNLGEKMTHAIEESFKSGYESVCIIGTDCLDLTEVVLIDAFENLRRYDAVIGPARDGGYYLLGMKKMHLEFFKNKTWSTSSVFKNTLADFDKLNLSYHVLPMLSDVDEAGDLPSGLF